MSPAPNAQSVWSRLGLERVYPGNPNTVAANLLRDVAMVVANPHARYVWRGQGNIHHTLHHALHRRLARADVEETDAELRAVEKRLIERARAAGYDQVAGRRLTDVELVALLQHEGAATRLLDVTPDPFIALFFACEHAMATNMPAALIAILVQDHWPIRPALVSKGGRDIIRQLDRQREGRHEDPSDIYLIETAFLNERMKAQRGQFIAGELPDDDEVAKWSSLDLELLDPDDEKKRIERLLDPTRGRPPAGGERPPLIVFRIRPAIRASLRQQLAQRFGYTTATIYPDLNGFARSFDQYAPLS